VRSRAEPQELDHLVLAATSATSERTSATRATEPARTRSLDGIRGVAILLVLVHNVGSVAGQPTGLLVKLWAVVSNAGWIGVQLFFALSGFLITRILLESKGAGGWLRAFYTRRALRIAPLYYVVLAIIFFVAPLVPALHAIAVPSQRSQLWYWTYLSNWIGPFGGTPIALPHVWSLAVEEQFYIFWPLLVGVISERALVSVSALLFALAIVLRLGIDAAFPVHIADVAAYTWTVTRWDAIALGAIVAAWTRQPNRAALLQKRAMTALVTVTAAVAVVMVFGRGLSANGVLGHVASVPLTGLLGACLVAVCIQDSSTSRARAVLVRALETPVLTTVGKYSYAVYVFHMPVHFLLQRFMLPYQNACTGAGCVGVLATYTIAVLVVSMLLAFVSWRLLEAPILSLKRYVPTPRGTGAATIGSPHFTGIAQP
jgi:peptidoglycan/LPS O-acetylase OafA/YrhL